MNPEERFQIPVEVIEAVKRGWSVIPVGTDKRPLIPSWKSFQAQAPSMDQIEAWGKRLRPPAWAVITGVVSKIVILDLDGESGWRSGEQMGLCPHVRTGGGGGHVYLSHPGFYVPTLNSKAKISLGREFPSIDIKGDGGYAVFWGQNAKGRYEWLRDPIPDSVDILPLRLRMALGLVKEVGRPPVELLLGKAKDLVQGGEGRNNAGFWLACQLRDNDYSPIEAEEALLRFAREMPLTNQKGEEEEYTEREARASVKQSYSRNKREPWGEETGKRETKKETRYRLVTNMRRESVKWLWEGRIPLDMVTIIDGDPDLGKSTVTLDLAARVSTGSPMPGEETGTDRKPGLVLLLSAEDDENVVIAPRLHVMEADGNRVACMCDVIENGKPRPPFIPEDIDSIEEVARRMEADLGLPVRLIVIDPLMAYLSVDAHKDQEVRTALRPLARMAHDLGAAILIVRHLNKNFGNNPLYRGGGSIGIIGAARAGLLISKDPEDERRRVLAVSKLNIGEKAPSLAYRLLAAGGTCRVSWEGECRYSASDLLQPIDEETCGQKLLDAQDFLRTSLEGGPKPAVEILREARESLISKRTLERAIEALQIRKAKLGFNGGWLWSLS